MVIEDIPPDGLVKRGQRWIRKSHKDSCYSIVIEVTITDGRSITGIILQSEYISFSSTYNSSTTVEFSSDIFESPCIYTYLKGQDAPIKLATE